jgi:hypothetical protein
MPRAQQSLTGLSRPGRVVVGYSPEGVSAPKGVGGFAAERLLMDWHMASKSEGSEVR